jgi:hypothetical protein
LPVASPPSLAGGTMKGMLNLLEKAGLVRRVDDGVRQR